MNEITSKKININKNLVYLRKSSHMSIEEVADKIGVSRQAVAKWENGDTINVNRKLALCWVESIFTSIKS